MFQRKGFKVAVILAVGLLVVACATLVGCNSNSPAGAVDKYLSAWQNSDWTAIKASVAPAKRNLTKVQDELAKQKFQQTKVKLDGISTATEYDKNDKNKAVVTLTNGKITYTAEILGKSKTETQDIGKMPVDQRPFFDTVKVNGVWYVNFNLG
jgi:uncharacterized membrane protein YvbJ